ncbi:hypothetical protein CAPTEDRAFT_195746 [Capitella teleta]|uniref:Calponin-homology (CH) domain-containing protein n=1 Tax=Capitella teleta TaxID=283909 RepID=R7UQB4_CAPTE|nr:hypothetical protein CAPTEDRAFT_195746 [Capitella teleta]|eukprot:ELU05581.1 hypothetical protein CAPTEDRAFT_195746 [Capitella teleta]
MAGALSDRNMEEYDLEFEKEICEWMKSITGIPVVKGVKYPLKADRLHEALKNGEYLCKLLNTLNPNSVTRVLETRTKFKMEENLSSFLEGCRKYGVADQDLFTIEDLFEKQKMMRVLITVKALRNIAQANQ